MSVYVRTQRLNYLIVSRTTSEDSTIEAKTTTLNRDTLLDAFDVLYNECNKDALKKHNANILDFTKKFRNPLSEVKKMRVNADDFTIKGLIGRGYFGEVHLAIENVTRDVYAIKKVPKTTFAQSKEERNVMAISRSEWIPTLQYAFQDQSHLYLAMEYLPGGDLFSLMVRRGTFAEREIQFYLAEIALALNDLHSIGYVHRDIKPENILIDRLGHLKLTDFGSAAVIEKDGHVTSYIPIGTPDYIAPEILQPIHSRRPMKTTYNENCDFWSMGVIAYEMLTESNPFRCDSVHDTYAEILAYIDSKDSKKLQFPSDADVSDGLKDLINGLVANKDRRFDYRKIRIHTFFDGIDWLNIRHQVPPIIPTLNGEHDTSNFEEDSKKMRRNNTYNAHPSTTMTNSSFSGNDLPFVGFSYVHSEFSSDMHEDESNRSEVNRLKMQVKSLRKTIDNQMVNISSLQQSSTEYQRKSCQAVSVEKILAITKEELHNLKEKLREKTVDVANCRTQIKTLKNSLKIEEEQRTKNDANISDVLNLTYQKWERAKKLSEQNYEKQIAEKNAEIVNSKQKLRSFEKELESKSDECANLQKTIDDLKERLRSSKNQSSSEKNDFVKKHRESNVHFEGQLRELRAKLQKQTDAKNLADDEIQKLRSQIEENDQQINSISDQKYKLDQANGELTEKLNQEIDENGNLRATNARIMQQMQELQSKIDELTNEIRQNHRSIVSPASSTIERNASVCCSLESISSDLELQLKRDLALAKECENEQRSRANDLERTVARLEQLIERLDKQEISTVDEFLERKNEKLTEELRTVHEKAKIEQKMRSTACLEQWKSQKELETVNREKQRLEHILEKVKGEKDELEQKMTENCIVLRSREERIAELQGDLAALKKEIQNERGRWESGEKERNKDKAKIVNQDTKINRLEIDLDECRSKMRLFEQQKDALTSKNQELIQQLRKYNEDLEEAEEKQREYRQSYGALGKNHDMLKKVCSLMETQLNELEEMYNAQLEQSKTKSATVDKLWADVRDRDGKLLKLQQELRDEKAQKVDIDQKLSETTNELCQVKESLADCNEKLTRMQQELLMKIDSLLAAEELIEVQKEEIQNLHRVNQTIDRELIIMKEENAKIRTEWAVLHECNEKLQLEFRTLHESYTDAEKEIEQLNDTIADLHKYQKERELKSEATQSQYKKLIDYLQKRVDELTQKKKKTLAAVLFGSSNNSSRKENIPSTHNQLQDELRREKVRMSTKSTKSTKVSNSIASTLSEEKIQANLIVEPKMTMNSSVKSKSISTKNMEMHLFERISQSNGSNASEKCLVCKKHFLSDSVYQCQECGACVHQYCRGSNTKCTVRRSSTGDTVSIASIASIDSDSSVSISTSISPGTEYKGKIILKETDSTPELIINCIHEMADSILLLGCESGIKAFNIDTEKLVHVANIDNVISIAAVPTFPKALLITDNGSKLVQCDYHQLRTRAKAAVCLNTSLESIELNISNKRMQFTYDQWRFVRIFDNTERNEDITEPIAMAATHTQIVIWRYNVEYQRFQAIHSLDTAEPVQSIYFTSKLSAIVCSNKIFEIDLMNLGQNRLEYEEFCDECDETLAHTNASKPLNSFAINGYEYLLCFRDFGVFVDEYGRRSRSNDINWLNASLINAFAYRAPILFVFSEDGIQMIRIKKTFDNDDQHNEEKMLQSFISASNAKFGTTFGKYGVYALTSSRSTVQGTNCAVAQQIIQIDAIKALRMTLADSLDTVCSSEIDS